MALTINWLTKVITVPKADTTLIQSTPTEIRQLDLNVFRLELKDIEDSPEGMAYIRTHNHNTAVTVGGVTLARVVEIINGYTVTFEDGQYAVNLVGANSNVADVVNVNQVSVRSANSAGLVTSQAIEFGEFEGKVWVSQSGGTSGSVYPKGTLRDPVNNLTDAKLIADFRGFDTVQLIGDFTFLPTDTLDDFTMIGQSISRTNLTLTDSAIITNCTFEDAHVSGTLDGNSEIHACHIENLNYTEGDVHDCQLNSGVIKLGGSGAGFVNCWSGIAGGSTPTIDFNHMPGDLLMRNYSGGLKIVNKTDSGGVSIDILSGQILLDSSNTFGNVYIRGMGKLVNECTDSCAVFEELLDSRNLNKPVYGGGVDLDTSSVYTGAQFPTGTPQRPVNNLVDALQISAATGIKRIDLNGFISATDSNNLDGLEMKGGNGSGNVLMLSGASTEGSEFTRLIMAGAFDGLARIENCILGTTGLGGMSQVQGRVVKCIINHTDGIIQDSAGAGTLFDHCDFIAPYDPQITLDCNNKSLSLKHCTGNILVKNKTDAEVSQINLAGAYIELDSSCTAGGFVFTGLGVLTDNSGVGCTVTANKLAPLDPNVSIDALTKSEYLALS